MDASCCSFAGSRGRASPLRPPAELHPPSSSLYSCCRLFPFLPGSRATTASNTAHPQQQQQQWILQLQGSEVSAGRGRVHLWGYLELIISMPQQLGVLLAMAVRRALAFFLLFCTILLLGSLPMPGHGYKDAGNYLPKSRKELNGEAAILPALHTDQEKQEYFSQGGGFGRWGYKDAGRLMIGSTAPTCTYNECRGCRFKCRAEQVPVDANDPFNSAYHYRCVCHKYY